MEKKNKSNLSTRLLRILLKVNACMQASSSTHAFSVFLAQLLAGDLVRYPSMKSTRKINLTIFRIKLPKNISKPPLGLTD